MQKAKAKQAVRHARLLEQVNMEKIAIKSTIVIPIRKCMRNMWGN